MITPQLRLALHSRQACWDGLVRWGCALTLRSAEMGGRVNRCSAASIRGVLFKCAGS